MRVTNPEVIKSGEDDLIDAITADVDWGAIEKIFEEKHKLTIEDDVEYKNGDIVVYNNQVAYKLEFDVKVTLSVLLDREGNYVSMSGSGDPVPADDTDELNAPAESAEDHDGDEGILEEVLSDARFDEGTEDADVIAVSSRGESNQPDDDSGTVREGGESREQKEGALSMA